MPLASGIKLGPYEIIGPLGAGGMGEVYRARDLRLGRDVAVKILPAEFSSDPVRKQRFEREAKTISGLNHPNICVLHDVGSQNDLDYLVMEERNSRAECRRTFFVCDGRPWICHIPFERARGKSLIRNAVPILK
jgi:serine/threonine protein kinase